MDWNIYLKKEILVNKDVLEFKNVSKPPVLSSSMFVIRQVMSAWTICYY